MPRYIRYIDAIDADALIRRTAELEAVALKQVANCDPSENPEQWNIWMAILTERTAFKYDLLDAPIVDAVEVVRCKDCKHYKGLAECDVIGDCMGTDGYCAWGERMDEVTNG